jgi:hypothetical protein
MIFDCCHSGGNTRNGFVAEGSEDIRERRITYDARLSKAFPRRDWNDFIFAHEIKPDDLRGKLLYEVLPEGKHIQMAACQNDESAFETGGEGIFTRNLIQVLRRSEGSVTYYDLQSRIQNYIRGQFNQTPKTYVVGEDESAMFQNFLDMNTMGKPLYGNITFNESHGWIIDLGAMQGLSSDALVRVCKDDGGDVTTARVVDVAPVFAVLSTDRRLNEKDSYKGYLTQYSSAQLRIYIDLKEDQLRDVLKGAIQKGRLTQLEIVASLNLSDYLVRAENDKILLCKTELPGVPIVLPVEYKSNGISLLLNYLLHLSQFEYVRTLQNPLSFLFSRDPVEMSFYLRMPHANETEVKAVNRMLDLEFKSEDKTASGGSLRIKLRNKSDRKVYCALLYLSFNYGVHVKLLKDVVVGLEPNAEVWVLDGGDIGLRLEEEIIHYQYPASTSMLKLIVSTFDFKQQALRFELPPLPGPLDQAKRGLEFGARHGITEIDDWITRDIIVKVKNPFVVRDTVTTSG